MKTAKDTVRRLTSMTLAFALVLSCFAFIGATDVHAATAKKKPAKVTLKSVATTDGTAYLKWKKINGASGYEIYRKTAGGKWAKVQTVTKKTAEKNLTKRDKTVVQIINKKLKPGVTYSYKVRAYVKSGKSVKYGKFSKAITKKTKTVEGIRKQVLKTMNKDLASIDATAVMDETLTRAAQEYIKKTTAKGFNPDAPDPTGKYVFAIGRVCNEIQEKYDADRIEYFENVTSVSSWTKRGEVQWDFYPIWCRDETRKVGIAYKNGLLVIAIGDALEAPEE